MDPEVAEERRRLHLSQDFLPQHGGRPPEAEHRIASAAEYAAFHLGQINRKLDKLIELLEQRAAPK